MMKMPPKGYSSVTLPEELIRQVEEFIRAYPDLGFKNPTDFIKDAIRRRVERFTMLRRWGVEELRQEIEDRQRQTPD